MVTYWGRGECAYALDMDSLRPISGYVIPIRNSASICVRTIIWPVPE